MRRANLKIANRSAAALIGLGMIAAIPVSAQSAAPVFPVTLDKKLTARATKVEEVSMDKKMLGFASQFLNSEEADDREGKQIIKNLDGIYVREYEFDKAGQYTADDLDAIRRQFAGREWSPIVRERSLKNGENSDVYMKMVNGEVKGIFVMDAEPQALDLVYIDGPIRPGDLKHLSGNFGVPAIHTESGAGKAAKAGAQ